MTDTTAPLTEVTDTMIERAIDRHDDPDHPDAYSVAEIRDVLERINADVVAHWDAYADAIDDGKAHEVATETRTVIVLADKGHFWTEQFRAMDDLEDDDQGILSKILQSVHRAWADKHVDRTWATDWPVVIEKSDEFQAGEQHVLREIARRTDEFGSVARAVDSLATERYGYSQSIWADLSGRNPSTVSRTTDN